MIINTELMESINNLRKTLPTLDLKTRKEEQIQFFKVIFSGGFFPLFVWGGGGGLHFLSRNSFHENFNFSDV